MNIKSKINKSISSFLEYLLYQKGLSQNTVDSYKSDLTKLSNYLQNQDLSKTNIDNFFIDMSDFNYSSSTKKRMHSSICLLYTSPSPRDATLSRMPSSA